MNGFVGGRAVFSSVSSMKTVNVVRGLRRKVVRLEIVMKVLELYWTRL